MEAGSEARADRGRRLDPGRRSEILSAGRPGLAWRLSSALDPAERTEQGLEDVGRRRFAHAGEADLEPESLVADQRTVGGIDGDGRIAGAEAVVQRLALDRLAHEE